MFFSHGDIVPKFAGRGVDVLNGELPAEIKALLAYKGAVDPEYELQKTSKITRHDRVTSSSGPVASRDIADSKEAGITPAAACQSLKTSLEILHADYMIVGHTAGLDNKMKWNYGGRHVVNDLAMSRWQITSDADKAIQDRTQVVRDVGGIEIRGRLVRLLYEFATSKPDPRVVEVPYGPIAV